MSRKSFATALGLLALGLLISQSPIHAQGTSDQPIQIGMAKTFFNDIPQDFIDIATGPFDTMMKKTTGLHGRLATGDSAADLAHKLDNGQIQIGVFNGFEFAWAQKKFPNLEPLLVAVNKHRDVRSFILVHKDNPAKNLADLRGKTLAIALGTKEHCRVYVDRKCSDNNQPNAATFFGKIERSKSYEDALDDICRKNVDAAVVDTISLEFYKDIKLPFLAKHLRILQQSEPFPEAVIAIKKGVLPEEAVTKFRDGLVKANQDADGREMMRMWHIRGFEAVPATYSKSLADCLREYPAPATKLSMR